MPYLNSERKTIEFFVIDGLSQTPYGWICDEGHLSPRKASFSHPRTSLTAPMELPRSHEIGLPLKMRSWVQHLGLDSAIFWAIHGTQHISTHFNPAPPSDPCFLPSNTQSHIAHPVALLGNPIFHLPGAKKKIDKGSIN